VTAVVIPVGLLNHNIQTIIIHGCVCCSAGWLSKGPSNRQSLCCKVNLHDAFQPPGLLVPRRPAGSRATIEQHTRMCMFVACIDHGVAASCMRGGVMRRAPGCRTHRRAYRDFSPSHSRLTVSLLWERDQSVELVGPKVRSESQRSGLLQW
jgi:hypothetical protein